MRWLWGRKIRRDSTPVQQAADAADTAEAMLEEALERREYVDALGARVDQVLKVNGFGAAATAAMKRRHA